MWNHTIFKFGQKLIMYLKKCPFRVRSLNHGGNNVIMQGKRQYMTLLVMIVTLKVLSYFRFLLLHMGEQNLITFQFQIIDPK